MRKLIVIGSAVALTTSVACAKSLIALAPSLPFVKSHSDSSDNCPYCGKGVIVTPTPEPIQRVEECSYCGSGGSSTSSANWSKATTRSIYIVDQDGAYAGVATITTSKKSKSGQVSVKVVFKIAGKSYTAKNTAFYLDEDGTVNASWANVQNIGAVSLSITIDGEISGVAGVYEFSDDYNNSEEYESVFVHGEHMFSVDLGDYTISEKYDLIYETIPTDVEVVTSSKKWNCGTAPKIKYIKEDGEYVLSGLDDETKTNYSNLSITFNAKKNTFSGSFKVYATNEGSIEKGKPKLKSYKFTVKGHVSGGELTGTATCKALNATWSVLID